MGAEHRTGASSRQEKLSLIKSSVAARRTASRVGGAFGKRIETVPIRRGLEAGLRGKQHRDPYLLRRSCLPRRMVQASASQTQHWSREWQAHGKKELAHSFHPNCYMPPECALTSGASPQRPICDLVCRSNSPIAYASQALTSSQVLWYVAPSPRSVYRSQHSMLMVPDTVSSSRRCPWTKATPGGASSLTRNT
jgi:hypothetical protein